MPGVAVPTVPECLAVPAWMAPVRALQAAARKAAKLAQRQKSMPRGCGNQGELRTRFNLLRAPFESVCGMPLHH